MNAASRVLLSLLDTPAVSVSLRAGAGTGARRTLDATPITGIVRDVAGGRVPGASVTVRGGAREQHVTTGPDGRFTVAGSPSGDLVLIVRAPGFAEIQQTLPAGAPRTNLDLVLSPRPSPKPSR